MYYRYYDFTLQKHKDFIEISAIEECELENIDDDNIREHRSRNCLQSIINHGLTLSDYDSYSIFTFKSPYHNSVTDAKKVWRLGGFDRSGFFDSFYNLDNYRIYFGICKNPTKYMEDISSLNKVSLYIPQGDNLSVTKIFDIFKSTCFNAYSSIQDVVKTLSLLHISIEKGIIIYECPFIAKVYVFGKDIQNKNTFCLPKGEIIERINN